MKTTHAMVIAAGLVALAACNKKSPADNQASAVQANAENSAENVEASANNGPDPYVAVQTILDELLRDI